MFLAVRITVKKAVYMARAMNGIRNQPKRRRNDGYSVYERKREGRWEWSVTTGYDSDGKQVRARGYEPSRAKAVATAQKVANNHRKGGFVAVSKDSTLTAYLDQWITLHVQPYKEPKTTSFYRSNVETHLKPFLGKKKLRQLTPQDIQALIAQRKSEGRSSSTLHGILRTLRTALQTAWKEGLIEQNAAQKVTMPKLEQRKPDFLTPDEAKRLLQAAKGNPLESLIAFTLATGVRLGEVTGLTWECVDFARSQVDISQQLQRVDSKLTLKRLKSKSSQRTLHLPTIALTALVDEKNRQAELRNQLGEEFNPLNLVFLNTEGRPLDPRNVDKFLKQALAKAGCRPISMHKLRHTAATLMVAAGVELHQVKEQLGHSQISLTADLYAHGVDEAQRKAANRLDQVLNSGTLSG